MKLKVNAVLASIVALLAVVLVVPASAQEASSSSQVTNSGSSLRISPVRSEVSLDPGDSKKVTVYAQNLTPQPINLRVVVSDFEASKDESGTPLVILDDSYAKSHSLKRLASINPSVVTVAPNTRTSVDVTITVPKNAMAGGYYGAVRFLPAADATSDETGVAISTNVGSLVLLKVNGDTEETMSLASMDVRKNNKAGTFFTNNKDLKAVVRFNNEGNIQLQPFGKLRLLDRGGKVVGEYEVNNTDPRGNVLPESIRRFEVKLDKVGTFGKYTLEGNFGYGSNGQLLTSEVSFWVVPVPYMIAAGAALLVIGLIIFLIVKVMRLSGGRRRTYGRRY